ncbi:MAG: YfjI family protein [Pseudomonadota bacterium]|nr:YfjI family protein [Pseudomonadota bacterium]
MSGYEDIRYAIENSRSILADYNQRESYKLFEDVLIEKVVCEISASIKAPRALVMTKVISALSIGLQPLVDVQTPDGRIIPTSEYFFIIAKTGERKSAAEKKIYKPIYGAQIEFDKIHAELMRHYRRKLVIFEEKLKALKKDLRKGVSKGEDTDEIERMIEELLEAWPEHPCHIQLVDTDITPEALIYGMSQGSKYAAIASGEGGSVLRSAVMNDAPLINGLWGGETSGKKRKTTSSSMVVDGRLSISIDVQPEVFDEFLKKNGKIMHGSGFFARCFMSWPSSMIGMRYSEKTDNREDHYEEYLKRLTSYLKKLPSVVSGDEPRQVIKLSENAEKKMVTITNAIEHESNLGGMFEGHEGYSSKLAEKILRLACLLNVFEYGVDADITEGAVDHALHLGMYYAGQHLEIFKYKSPEEKDDELLLEWVSKKRHRGIRYIKKNDIRQQVCPIDLRNAKRLNPALERLEQHGEVKKYMYYKTECVDLMPGLPVDITTAMPFMGSGRIY